MKPLHPIDEIFRSKLGDHSTEAPMHLWDNIMEGRKKKPGFIFKPKHLFLLLILALGGSVLSIPYLQSEHEIIQSFPIPMAPEESVNETNEALVTIAFAEEAPSKIKQPAFSKERNQSTEELVLPVKKQRLPQNLKGTEKEEEIAFHTPQLVNAAETTPKKALAKEFSALPTTLASLLETERAYHFSYRDPDLPCGTPKNSPWSYYFDLLASPDITFRTLEAKKSGDSDYIHNRENTENTIYAFSLGFRVSAVSPSGISLRSGLNYSQITEVFDFEGWKEEIVIIGTDTFATSGPFEVYSRNKFRMIDVPLLVGYELQLNKKYNLIFNGGAYFNLILNRNGKFLSPHNEEVSFSSNDPNAYTAFRDRLGIGWYGSLGISYEMQQRTDLIIEPYFKIFPKSFSHEDYVLDQNYLTTGLFVGLRHRF